MTKDEKKIIARAKKLNAEIKKVNNDFYIIRSKQFAIYCREIYKMIRNDSSITVEEYPQLLQLVIDNENTKNTKKRKFPEDSRIKLASLIYQKLIIELKANPKISILDLPLIFKNIFEKECNTDPKQNSTKQDISDVAPDNAQNSNNENKAEGELDYADFEYF